LSVAVGKLTYPSAPQTLQLKRRQGNIIHTSQVCFASSLCLVGPPLQ
jgi:hypothetical protein